MGAERSLNINCVRLYFSRLYAQPPRPHSAFFVLLSVHMTRKESHDTQVTFKYAAAKECNSLPSELRDVTSLSPNIQFILILQMFLYFFVLYMP